MGKRICKDEEEGSMRVETERREEGRKGRKTQVRRKKKMRREEKGVDERRKAWNGKDRKKKVQAERKGEGVKEKAVGQRSGRGADGEAPLEDQKEKERRGRRTSPQRERAND
ncbi:hypothetical protein Tco_1515623 [Tanacetum coccineum]